MKKINLLLSILFVLPAMVFSQKSWVSSPGSSPVNSYRGATATYNSGTNPQLYIFGGWGTSSGNFNETSIYNFVGLTWESGPEIPENTKGGSAICIDDNIYILTGNDGGDNNINSKIFLQYNISSDTWNYLAEYPIAARYVAMTYNPDNGLIYCAGGSGDSYAAVDQVNTYDPENDLWTTCTPLPYPNSGGSALLYIGNHLYFIGGLINQPYDKVFKGLINIEDPTNIIWTQGASMPIEMTKISAGYIGNGQIIATELDGTFLYDISTDIWTDIVNKPTPVKGGNYASFKAEDAYTFAVSGGKDAADNIVDHVDYIIIDYDTKFPATFVLTSATGEPIENAEIEVSSFNLQTDEAGCAIQFLENGTYDYTAHYDELVANGSFTIDGESVYIENQLVVSINENIDQFSIYPNPTTGKFLLQSDNTRFSYVEIIDMVGKTVYQSKINNDHTSFNLEHLEKGIYFIKLTGADNNEFVQKLILE